MAHTGWSDRAGGLREVLTLCPPPELEAKYTQKMQALRDELDLRRKTEIHEVEERKNSHIGELMRNHEKAFADIKNYYNDITLKNLALISLLKVSPGRRSVTFPPRDWSWEGVSCWKGIPGDAEELGSPPGAGTCVPKNRSRWRR